MNIAIDMPQQLHKATTLKEIFAKIFSFHKDITSVLVCDPNQSKKIYKKLLKNIIDEVHKKIAKSEKR